MELRFNEMPRHWENWLVIYRSSVSYILKAPFLVLGHFFGINVPSKYEPQNNGGTCQIKSTYFHFAMNFLAGMMKLGYLKLFIFIFLRPFYRFEKLHCKGQLINFQLSKVQQNVSAITIKHYKPFVILVSDIHVFTTRK